MKLTLADLRIELKKINKQLDKLMLLGSNDESIVDKKRELQQKIKNLKNNIFERQLTERLINTTFEKRLDNENTPEEQLLKYQKKISIRVQSVALPKEHELFSLKTEGQVMNWMENKINNVHTAYHRIESKFDAEYEKVHWSNNKMQNERFLQTKKLYNCIE
jgi:hypothetical protein